LHNVRCNNKTRVNVPAEVRTFILPWTYQKPQQSKLLARFFNTPCRTCLKHVTLSSVVSLESSTTTLLHFNKRLSALLPIVLPFSFLSLSSLNLIALSHPSYEQPSNLRCEQWSSLGAGLHDVRHIYSSAHISSNLHSSSTSVTRHITFYKITNKP